MGTSFADSRLPRARDQAGDKISKKPFKRYPIIATKGPPRITRGFLWMGALGGGGDDQGHPLLFPALRLATPFSWSRLERMYVKQLARAD